MSSIDANSVFTFSADIASGYEEGFLGKRTITDLETGTYQDREGDEHNPSSE